MEATAQAGQDPAAVKNLSPSRRRIAKKSPDPTQLVREIYHELSRGWGPQHWWPAETPFEVIAGAILTQNTSWTNVERAITNLRAAGRMSADGIRTVGLEELEQLVRPSGYFRQKAKRLREFEAFVDAQYRGSLQAMLATPTPQLRDQLLGQKGIGPETADSILLYAGHHPIFVVDAYTRRVLERHEAIGAKAKYDEIRELVEGALSTGSPHAVDDAIALDPNRPGVHASSAMSTAAKSELAQRYNEMHGLFVQVGKHYCLKHNPKCEVCPLGPMLKRRNRRKSKV
jgi:endonuclease-3 related protein